MPFNSYPFILGFLPVALIGYHALQRTRARPLVIAWLSLCSLTYYCFAGATHAALLASSIALNHAFARAIAERRSERARRLWLAAGVAFNLSLLGLFKYTGFALGILSSLFDLNSSVPQLVLPLGISFYTFKQIAYLVDIFRDESKPLGFVEYLLFVSFFPHLLAGPITRERELAPQVGSSRVDLQACKLEYSIVSPK